MIINVNKDDDNDEDSFDTESLEKKAKKRRLYKRVADVMDSSFYALACLIYIILALTMQKGAPSGYDGWAIYWTVILLGGLPGGLYRAIKRRRFSLFPIWSVTCFAYLFLGMYAGMWHPYWVILFLIPVYYSIVSPIDSLIRDRELGKI